MGGECSELLIFIFFIKENWICAMTRHHAESNNDKKSSYSLWCQTMKPSFNDTNALFVS